MAPSLPGSRERRALASDTSSGPCTRAGIVRFAARRLSLAARGASMPDARRSGPDAERSSRGSRELRRKIRGIRHRLLAEVLTTHVRRGASASRELVGEECDLAGAAGPG